MKQKSTQTQSQPNTWRAAIARLGRVTALTWLALVFAASGLQAATYTWVGTGTTGAANLWNTSTNWDAAPTFTNTTDIVFYKSYGTENRLGALNAYTIRSLTFTNNATVDVSVLLVSGTGNAKTLTLGADVGNAMITVQAGANKNFSISSLAGAPTAKLALTNNLVVDQQSATATLTINVPTFTESASGMSLTKIGSGPLILASITNSYTGGTIVSNGTLYVNTVLPANMTIYGGTLAGNGTNSGAVTLNGGVLSPGATAAAAGTLTLQNGLTLATGSSADFGLTTATTSGGGVNDLVAVTGNLTLNNNNITVNPLAALTTGSPYTLMTFTGTRTGSLGSVTAGRQTGTVSYDDSSSPRKVTVTFAANAAASLVWNSTASSAWDVQTTANWTNTSSLVSPDVFYQGDNVTFDNTAGVQTSITLGASVTPLSVTVNSTANNFTLAGSGKISSGATLTKGGSSTFTLSTTNDYSGGTTISGGTLRLSGGPNLLPTAAGTVTLADTAGAVLDLNGNNQAIAGLTGGGTTGGNVTLGAGTLTVTGTGTYAGVISGAGVLAKSGSGAFTLTGTNTHSGGTTLSAGTLNLNQAKALGTGTFTISGGTLDNTSVGAIINANNNAQAWNGDFTFTGTQNLDLGTGAVTLSADRSVTVISNALSVAGPIGGGFSLTKLQLGTLVLSGANTFTGQMRIDKGTVAASTIANQGVACSLGAGTGTNAIIRIGSAQNTATLNYSGSGADTDRQLTLGSGNNVNLAACVINNNGSGALAFTNANFNISYAAAGPKNLILGGTNADNNCIAGIIVDNPPSAVQLTKTDAGVWTLAGANTYNGVTLVTNGTLLVNNSSGSGTGSGAVTVLTNATLGGTGTIGGNVTFALGAMALLSNASTLSISGSLTANDNVIKLNLPANVGVGTNLLATYNPTGSSGSFASAPVIANGGSFAANTTNFITTAGGQVHLVVQNLAPSTPPATNIIYTVSSGQLVLEWPNGLGWNLQAQTNSLNTGLTASWSTLTGATSPFTNTINPANPAVFYRLSFP